MKKILGNPYSALFMALSAALLLIPTAYLVAGSLDPAHALEILTRAKIPPEGEIYRIYGSERGVVIQIAGLDFGPLINSLALSALVATAVLALSALTSSACISTRRGRLALCYALPLASSVPTPFISAYAVLHLFHRDFGILNALTSPLGFRISVEGLAGVALYQVLHFAPLSHLLLISYMDSLDRGYAEASQSLGAGPAATVARILIPLSRPALAASWFLVLILSIEDLAGPITFSRHNYARNLMSYQAYYGFISEHGYQVGPEVSSYALVLILISALVALASWRFLRLSRLGGISVPGLYVQIPGAVGILLRGLASAVLAAAAVPNLMVLLYSLTWGWISSPLPRGFTLESYVTVITTPYYLRAVLNTLGYTAVSAALIVVVGFSGAYTAARGGRISSYASEALILVPLVIPGIALGIAYYQLFHTAFAGSPADPVISPWPYLFLTYAIRRFPYFARPAEAGLQGVPQSLEDAAQNLGSSAPRVMWGISLPAIFSPAAAGIAVSSIQVATEVSTSLVLIGTPGVSDSHPAPVTVLIASTVSYNPLGLHVASAMLVLTLALVAALSAAISRAISTALRIPRAQGGPG